MPFDLILQNNASKQVFLISGIYDAEETVLAYIFYNFQMPEKAPEGEYTGLLFRNGRSDVQYEFKDVILDSVAHTLEGDVELRYLRPEIFILKYGEIKPNYISQDKNKTYAYRKK